MAAISHIFILLHFSEYNIILLHELYTLGNTFWLYLLIKYYDRSNKKILKVQSHYKLKPAYLILQQKSIMKFIKKIKIKIKMLFSESCNSVPKIAGQLAHFSLIACQLIYFIRLFCKFRGQNRIAEFLVNFGNTLIYYCLYFSCFLVFLAQLLIIA